MAAKSCADNLNQLMNVVHLQGPFMRTLCVLSLGFSLVTIIGNLLVIRALWKASSIPDVVRKLFLSLAFSDLGVGILPQPMFGIIIAVMLKMASTGDNNFAIFCPTMLTVCYFFLLLLSCASFLNVTAIAVDRLVAISLHLRYQELVTSKRVIIALVSLWVTSGVVASIFIALPKGNDLVIVTIVSVGLLVTTVAYIRIYKVVRYHQNQIQSQLQVQNAQALELLRQKKSAKNALFVYVVFLACYLPCLISIILLIDDSLRISFLAAYDASVCLSLLNSSLNPLVYCWRYREIRKIVKLTVKKIFRMN